MMFSGERTQVTNFYETVLIKPFQCVHVRGLFLCVKGVNYYGRSKEIDSKGIDS